MSQVNNNISLKIKVSNNDDIRMFKGNFSNLKEGFSNLEKFIRKSFKLNKASFIIQYKDDENDLVTIANELDLNDAISYSKSINKCCKVYIKQIIKNNKKLSKPKKIEKKEDNNNDISGDLVKDICNNESFKKEFIAFLVTFIELYQKQKDSLSECLAQSLSMYKQVGNHKMVNELVIRANYVLSINPQINMYLFSILSQLKSDKIEEMVENFVKMNKNGGNMNELFPGMMMFGNLLSNNNNNNNLPTKNCPGKHGIKYFYTPQKGYECDECSKHMNKNDEMYGCRLCNYDLCTNCYNGNANNVNIDPRMFMFMNMGNGYGLNNNFSGFCGRKRGKFGKCNRKYWKYCNNDNDNNNNEKILYVANMVDNPLPIISSGIVDANEGIIKTWKMINAGNIPLPKGLLVKYSGRRNNPMISTETFYVGNNNEILPGNEFTVSICIKTPNNYGRYSSNWRLCTPNGKKFGQRLPFYLVLSPPNVNNNNNNDNKSELDEITNEIVKLVKKESELQNDIKNNENELDIKKVTNEIINESELNENNNNIDPDECEIEIDMDINNDSDNDDDDDDEVVISNIITNPNKKDDKNDDNIEIKEDIADINNDEDVSNELEPIIEESESEYIYENEFIQVKNMGFEVPNDIIKMLLNEYKGNIDEVVLHLIN